MRRAANLDRNHAEVVNALERIGAKVQSLASMGGGVPDLLVGYHGVNVLLEVKDGTHPPSKRLLTAEETKWQGKWAGQVNIVNSAAEAQQIVIAYALHWNDCKVGAQGL